MVVRKYGRLCVASRFVRSDQAKIIILVLADETYSRFVMSPMFSADHRKVDCAGFKTESDISARF